MFGFITQLIVSVKQIIILTMLVNEGVGSDEGKFLANVASLRVRSVLSGDSLARYHADNLIDELYLCDLWNNLLSFLTAASSNKRIIRDPEEHLTSAESPASQTKQQRLASSSFAVSLVN